MHHKKCFTKNRTDFAILGSGQSRAKPRPRSWRSPSLNTFLYPSLPPPFLLSFQSGFPIFPNFFHASSPSFDQFALNLRVFDEFCPKSSNQLASPLFQALIGPSFNQVPSRLFRASTGGRAGFEKSRFFEEEGDFFWQGRILRFMIQFYYSQFYDPRLILGRIMILTTLVLLLLYYLV
ncbi:uncharacterized protein LOC116190346 [Punica granatum]|uniref:Uncharacterized protein LOC116190346 n=1 Tax=Punica granatum TaxID=22663 RepID=A0A6P8C023_PUNGR|nr:uncharacterized protein LOC116190346 [Punica granatum]